MKKVTILVLVLALILTVIACGKAETQQPAAQNAPAEKDAQSTNVQPAQPAQAAAPEPAKKGDTYVLSLGGTTGNFYLEGAALADYVNANYSDVMQLLPSTSAGGVENVRNVYNGDAAFGPAFPRDVVMAYNGSAYGTKMDSLRMVGIAQKPNACAIVVLKDSGINTVYDLAGKTVAPGAPGSSAYDMFMEFAKHIGIADSLKVVNYGNEELPGKVTDGSVDAFCVMTMAETAAGRISQVSALKDIRILDVTDVLKETGFLEAFPWYSSTILPGGQYAGQDEPVNCFSAYPVWITNAAVPEEIVYQFLNIGYSDGCIEYLNGIIKGHGHDVPNQLETAFPIPLHAGAEKYWKEHGYTTFPEPAVK